MKPKPMNAKRKAEFMRAGTLDTFVSENPGPFDPVSLSRSYGVELPEVIRILQQRGKHHG